MKFNDKTYNILKWIAMYLLPALGALYFGVAAIWGLPYAEQVVGTITVFDTFLGVLLGISTNAYNKSEKDGTLQIDTTDTAKDVYRLSINGDLSNLSSKKSITLSVSPGTDLSHEKQLL